MWSVTLYDCTCPTCGKEAPGIMRGGVLSVPEHRLMTMGETCPGSGDAPVSLHPSASKPVEVECKTGLPTDGRYMQTGYDSTSHWWDGYIQPRDVGN